MFNRVQVSAKNTGNDGSGVNCHAYVTCVKKYH